MQNNKFDVIILAGGKGTRIKKFLKNKPKPMIKIQNLNFLDILIKNFSKYNINKIYIAAGYKGDKIFKKFHNKKVNLVDIKCIIEKKTLGTGGSLSQFNGKTTKKFFVINGDTFFDIDLNKIFYKYKNSKKIYLALSNSNNYKTNVKLTNLSIKNKKLVIYDKKSKYFNGGIYFFDKSIFKKIPTKNFSLENELISNEIKKRNIIGDYYNNFFLDIGTPEAIKHGLKKLENYLKKPAIFIDRDGTLIEDNGYTHKIKDLKFKENTINFIKKFKNKKYLFLVTNQSGIGRGYFTENDFFNFQKFLKEKIYKKNILIDDIRYCPFIANAKLKKYRKKSKFRKPGNLMIKSLLNNFFVDLNKSFMIGNSSVDQICAIKSKLRYIDVDGI